MIERVNTSLQIEENIDLHIRGWVIQRIGWGLMLTFMGLAALGLFGNGFLSSKTISHDGTSLEFERFTRRANNTEVTIQRQSNDGSIKVALSALFVSNFKIEKIVPEPSGQKIVDGSNVYVFPAEGEGKVTLFVTARQNGEVNTAIAVNDVNFQFHTYVYP